VGLTHWDEAETRRLERGQMAATWTNLGTPAGTYRCGVHRIEMAPGEQPTPAHVRGEAEEIFYVLGGSGLTWMDVPHVHSIEEEIFVVPPRRPSSRAARCGRPRRRGSTPFATAGSR
jgi:mannose-6-phosphate isomerase-like protein (cupin superfamily)